MASSTNAAAADFEMPHQLESGVAPPSDITITRSVSQSIFARKRLLSQHGEDEDLKVEDSMTYHCQVLLTWHAFRSGAITVWSRGQLWAMVLRLALVSLCVAVLTFVACPNPAALSVDKFTQISLFLRTFVGLLLGFFLFSSMNRWYECCSGFLILFDAIRNLQMQFIALGCADEEHAMLAIRYGVLSAHLLNMELHAEVQRGAERKQALDSMWAKLAAPSGEEVKNDISHCGTVYEGELEILQEVDDASGLMWMWVASLIGRMAQDGSIPGMPTPTFGRIMSLAQLAHGGIRQVRSCTNVQAPYIYVHMLAVVVHINNLLNAVSFGLILGTTSGTWLAYLNVHPGKSVPADSEDAERDFQTLVVAFFFCVCGPVLYQAFLEVAVIIAMPFASKDGEIPTKKMISRLEIDLQDAFVVSRQCPWWQKPSFKPPPAA